MYDGLLCSLEAIRWPETISALASVATAIIAFCALRTWRHQDKAKRKAEFLDEIIEATHTYIAEMAKPITLFEMAKVGMHAHVPISENGDPENLAAKGAIAYIVKYGEQHSKRLLEMLETVRPTVVNLKSLAVKGQVFRFENYEKCLNTIQRLTWHFDRINSFNIFIGSPTFNWENSEILNGLKDIIAIEPNEIRKSIQENNASLVKFSREAYKQIYG